MINIPHNSDIGPNPDRAQHFVQEFTPHELADMEEITKTVRASSSKPIDVFGAMELVRLAKERLLHEGHQNPTREQVFQRSVAAQWRSLEETDGATMDTKA